MLLSVSPSIKLVKTKSLKNSPIKFVNGFSLPQPSLISLLVNIDGSLGLERYEEACLSAIVDFYLKIVEIC